MKLAYHFTRIRLRNKASKIGERVKDYASLQRKHLTYNRKEKEGWDNEVDLLQSEILYILASTNSWYNDLKYYLTHGSSPNHLDS